VRGYVAPRGQPSTYIKSSFLFAKHLSQNVSRRTGVIHLTDGYKHQRTYLCLLYKQGQIVDIVPVKTTDTLNVYIQGWTRFGIQPMILPNPVKVPRKYWEEYRKKGYKSNFLRLKLAKYYGLLRDSAILNIETLVLDVDSPYEKVFPVWEELKKKLKIEKGYTLVKTKRGNFRVYIYIKPTYIVKKKVEVRKGKLIEKVEEKEFFLSPRGQGRNGKTHLENAQELQAILLAFFHSRGLKADYTFLGRLNHPVWVEGWEIDYKRSEIMEEKEGYAGRLYDLYRRAKHLQREEKLWELGKTNLTHRFWERTKRKKVVMPTFVVRKLEEKLDALYKWKCAVKKLAERYTTYRFTRVILPAVGWAKALNLDRSEVESYLQEVLPDKKNFKKDMEKAWRYAHPTYFEWKGDEISIKKYLIAFLKIVRKGVFRQDLLKTLFKGQNWLLEQVERFALKEGLIRLEKIKRKTGRGRKAYFYSLTEKGEAFLNPKRLKNNGDKKSIYKTPPMGEQCNGLVVVGLSTKEVGCREKLIGGKEIELKKYGGKISIGRKKRKVFGSLIFSTEFICRNLGVEDFKINLVPEYKLKPKIFKTYLFFEEIDKLSGFRGRTIIIYPLLIVIISSLSNKICISKRALLLKIPSSFRTLFPYSIWISTFFLCKKIK